MMKITFVLASVIAAVTAAQWNNNNGNNNINNNNNNNIINQLTQTNNPTQLCPAGSGMVWNDFASQCPNICGQTTKVTCSGLVPACECQKGFRLSSETKQCISKAQCKLQMESEETESPEVEPEPEEIETDIILPKPDEINIVPILPRECARGTGMVWTKTAPVCPKVCGQLTAGCVDVLPGCACPKGTILLEKVSRCINVKKCDAISYHEGDDIMLPFDGSVQNGEGVSNHEEGASSNEGTTGADDEEGTTGIDDEEGTTGIDDEEDSSGNDGSGFSTFDCSTREIWKGAKAKWCSLCSNNPNADRCDDDKATPLQPCFNGTGDMFAAPLQGVTAEKLHMIKIATEVSLEECRELCVHLFGCTSLQMSKDTCRMFDGRRPNVEAVNKWKGKKRFTSQVRLHPCMVEFGGGSGTGGVDVQGETTPPAALSCHDQSIDSQDKFSEPLRIQAKGKFLRKEFAANQEACGLLCLELGVECIGFQYKYVQKKNKGICWAIRSMDATKSKKSKGWTVSMKACTTGDVVNTQVVIGPATPCPATALARFYEHSNSRLQGSQKSNLKEFRRVNLENCANHCINTMDCVAFEFNAKFKMCELKKAPDQDGKVNLNENEKWSHFELTVMTCA